MRCEYEHGLLKTLGQTKSLASQFTSCLQVCSLNFQLAQVPEHRTQITIAFNQATELNRSLIQGLSSFRSPTFDDPTCGAECQ